jgi:hypothetical protein
METGTDEVWLERKFGIKRTSLKPNNNQTTGVVQGTRWKVGGRK